MWVREGFPEKMKTEIKTKEELRLHRRSVGKTNVQNSG